MKKSIIVLLIAVLVAGFAFAGTLSGKAGLYFDTDLQNKTWGFENSSDWKYTFTFKIDTTKVKVEGDKAAKAWAELEIEGAANAKVNGNKNASSATSKTDGTITHDVTVTLKSANIHVPIGEKDLVFGLLNSGAAVDYAKSYWGNPQQSKVGGPARILPGFTVSFDGYSGGFGAKGKWTDEKFFYNIFAHAKTKDFKFAQDAVVVQGGIWTALSNETLVGYDWAKKKVVGAGISVTYGGRKANADKGIEADKVTAHAKADVSYEFKESNSVFNYEVAADASYTIAKDETVKLELYLLPGKLHSTAVYKDGNADALKLDVKLSYNTHTFTFDKTTLALSGSADLRDSLIDKRTLTLSATEVLTLGAVEKSLKFTFTESYEIFDTKELALSAKVDYTAKEDKFVVTATVAPTLQFKDSDKDLIKKFSVSGEIYSEKIISLAKIGLKYSSANFAKNDKGKSTNLGKVSAYVEIKFPNELPKPAEPAKDAPAAN